MSKIVLSDHDILLKLAVWELLDGLPTVLQVARQEVFVLPTAKFKLNKLVGKSHDQAVWNRLDAFLRSVREVVWTIPPDEQKLFEDTMGIDPGEAVLFSATAQHLDYLLATGDKGSLKALARSPGCRAVVERLKNHVICLEQIVKHSITHFGFEFVRNKVATAPPCDTAMNAVFGSGLLATEENVMSGLDSYIGDLRRSTVDLLVP